MVETAIDSLPPEGPISRLAAKVRAVRHVVRLRPFDLSTEEGRALERHRRLVLTAASAFLAKATSMAAGLAIVPLTIRYLGSEQYGLWATVAAAVSMCGSADLGMGQGLMTWVAEASSRNDRAEIRRYISSAFFGLAAIGLALIIAISAGYRFVPWSRLLNVGSSLNAAEAGPITVVLICCLAAQFPASVGERVRMGYQEGFANSLWQCLGSLFTLAAVAAAVWARLDLKWLVLGAASGPVVAATLNSAILYRYQRPWVRPSLAHFSGNAALRILQTGSLFFVLNTAGLIGLQSDNIVIDHFLGPSAVTQYSVTARLFAMPWVITSFALMPLWPAYREAIARGDMNWVRKTFRRSLLLTIAVQVPITIVLLAGARPIIHIWAGRDITPSMSLIIATSVWAIFTAFSGPLAMLLNGLNVVRLQVICAVAMAGMNLALSIYLAKRIGSAGVVWGSVISCSLCSVLPCALAIPRLLARASSLHTGQITVGMPTPADS